MAIGNDARMFGFIHLIGPEEYRCHVLCCDPSAIELSQALQEACVLRYQKAVEAKNQRLAPACHQPEKTSKRKISDEDSTAATEGETEVEEEKASSVIDGEDIQQLAVDPDDLERIEEAIEEARRVLVTRSNMRQNRTITVRKNNMSGDADADYDFRNRITLLKRKDSLNWPVHEDDLIFGASHVENLKDWQLIGSKEDFIESAMGAGEMDKRIGNRLLGKPSCITRAKMDLSHEAPPVYKLDSRINSKNALKNWQDHMTHRKKQQGYISSLLQKENSQLIGMSGEDFRHTLEVRELIDRAIPAVDKGKGFRVGSEFWRQYETIGPEETGLKMSLGLSEKGQARPLERIGKPKLVKEETCESKKYAYRPDSEYLVSRTEKLKHILAEIEGHRPDIDNIIVKGKEYYEADTEILEDQAQQRLNNGNFSDSASEESSIVNGFIRGPAVRVEDYVVTAKCKNGHPVYLYFDTMIGELKHAKITITNVGTTVAMFDWHKEHREISFDGPNRNNKQRFFFNAATKKLLPGQSETLQFSFKTEKKGHFHEVWSLQLSPSMPSFTVSLKGIGRQPENDNKSAKRLREEALSASEYILNKVLQRIRPKPQPLLGEAPKSEEELFKVQNPTLPYRYQPVENMRRVWLKYILRASSAQEDVPTIGLVEDESSETVEQVDTTVEPWDDPAEWDYDIPKLKREILALDDFESKEDALQIIEEALVSLLEEETFLPLPQPDINDVLKNVVGECIERIGDEMNWIRQAFKVLPVEDFPELKVNRPSSSETTLTSISKRDLNLRKTPSATRKTRAGNAAKEAALLAKEAAERAAAEKAAAEAAEKAAAAAAAAAAQKKGKGGRRGKASKDVGPPKVEIPPVEVVSITDGWRDIREPENANLQIIMQRKMHHVVKELLGKCVENLCDVLSQK
ncbi:Oidioi.mRNA.OKI2018_I69.XSR.g14748.t1.cds [Oikopleura dioica]|uniref:Oidioi.mRNA.OKI2018_I69.XSR.g14748.t1.cds n=1 Tax=Oikopleura dioica TaxID=34765 RepID=A0ABN7SH11_OIKDI|nr:Oidioi.mRNA.OKI2018_I69.XSR.g14748.t1.cds [Oikopleura dioica]